MSLSYMVLFAMACTFAVIGFVIVMVAGRSIAYKALNASETQETVSQLVVNAAGIVWYCASFVILIAGIIGFVPGLSMFTGSMEPVLLVASLVHLLCIPTLVGSAALLVGDKQSITM